MFVYIVVKSKSCHTFLFLCKVKPNYVFYADKDVCTLYINILYCLPLDALSVCITFSLSAKGRILVSTLSI